MLYLKFFIDKHYNLKYHMALFNTSVSNVMLKKNIKKEFVAKIEVLFR